MKLPKYKIPVLILLINACLLSCNPNEPKTQKEEQKTQTATPGYSTSQEIPIWPKSIPDSELIQGTETYNDGMVNNVSHPTITIFSPKENNTRAAVLVFPGGGYN